MTRVLTNNIAGIILAGGASTRMGGGDKTLLELGGNSILGYVVERLNCQVGLIAINSNSVKDRFLGYGCPVIADEFPERLGPLAGVLAGMEWAAKGNHEWIVTVAGDTPFFPTDLVRKLANGILSINAQIALAATTSEQGRHSRHPTFGLWDVSLRRDLRQAIGGGVRKVVHWSDRHRTTTVEFECRGFDPFFNINTPQDLARAREILLDPRT